MLEPDPRLAAAAVLFGFFSVGCGGHEPVDRVVVVVTARPASASTLRPIREVEPEVTWTPEPELSTPTPQGYVLALPVPTPRPTTDVASIPNFDRPRAPTPASRTEQLAGCLTFSTEALSRPTYAVAQRMRVRVRARNDCSSWIPAEDTRFEIVSSGGAGGGTLGRESGMFQAPIPPLSANAETMIEIDCPNDLPGGCRFTASVWGAAGGERKPE